MARSLLLLAGALWRAGFSLVIERVVFALLPAVAQVALDIVRTAVDVIDNELLRLPVRARSCLIVAHMWLPPEVLPIMSIDAESFVMLCEVERTPDGLEMEHIEVIIVLIIVY